MIWNSDISQKKIRKISLFIAIVLMVSFGIKMEYNAKVRGNQESPTYNVFLQKYGDFSFSYKNNYEVRQNKGIYYLQEISTQNPVFQLFKKTNEISYNENDYLCDETHELTFCYSANYPEEVIQDIKFFPETLRSPYEILSRAETLQWLLDIKYPDTDFSKYANNCFYDVTPNTEFSGHICYAKEKGIVMGIGNNFFPQNSINLHGLLKILFLTFEEDDYKYDKTVLDQSMFELMTPYHFAYDLLAKSYYEGLFNNVTGQDIWSNRNIYKSEADQIANNFFHWQNGKTLRVYIGNDDYPKTQTIYIKNDLKNLTFIQKDPNLFDSTNKVQVKLKQNDENLEIYAEENGNVYEFIASFPNMQKENIKKTKLSYNKDRLRINILFEFEDDTASTHYELKISTNDFAYLQTKTPSPIADKNISPNEISKYPPEGIAPKIQLYMSEEDFKSILENRTINQRYPVYAHINHPNQNSETFSALIKIRGNANRSHVKSAYTIESFDEFSEGFLKGSNEFKLRSMIGDESMTKEEIVYSTFSDLGYIEPEILFVTLEINNVPFGFYQLTESVKAEFFERRNIQTNYVYAKNISSPHLANLEYESDENILTTHYKISEGEESQESFMQFLYRIKINDKSLLQEIDIQNIFDYTFITYAFNLNDSLTSNYYLYIEDDLWKMFFWDADACFGTIPEINKDTFKQFANNSEGDYNALVYFVFSNMDQQEFDDRYENIVQRLNKIQITEKLNTLLKTYKDFYEFDNSLWNGKYLERTTSIVDTIKTISKLKEKLLYIENQLK